MERPQTFLFDADEPAFSGDYGTPCNLAVAQCLLATDPSGRTRSRFLFGDILILDASMRLARISSRATTEHPDRRRLIAFAWDLAESLAADGSFERADLFSCLTTSTVYAVTLPSLPDELAGPMHELLSTTPGYLGTAALDPGNLLHRQLVHNYLIDRILVEHRSIFLVDDGSGEEQTNCDPWVRSAGFTTIQVLGREEYAFRAPQLLAPVPPSPRAVKTQRLLEQHRPSHHELVARSLFVSLRDTDVRAASPEGFSTRLPNNVPAIIVPKAKLVRYALDPAHPEGRHKARVFSSALGIRASDWTFLAAQLTAGLETARLECVRSEQHGVKYEALIPVRGRNGITRLVATAWIIKELRPAQLVTAYVANESSTPAVPARDVVGIPDQLSGERRWRLLLAHAIKAGRRAAAGTIPTPLLLAGFDPVEEGECGGSFVVVPDARRGFARWLRMNGYGHEHHPSGQRFSAAPRSQSAERAHAFARAFAEVLQLSGVECTVHDYLV